MNRDDDRKMKKKTNKKIRIFKTIVSTMERTMVKHKCEAKRNQNCNIQHLFNLNNNNILIAKSHFTGINMETQRTHLQCLSHTENNPIQCESQVRGIFFYFVFCL